MYQQQQASGDGPTKGETPWGIIIVVFLALATLGTVLAKQGGEPPPATRPAAASCPLSQALVEEGMVSYLRAHARGDDAQKETLRERLLSYTACAPGVRTALDIWLRAVDADNQQGMTAADERFILAFRQLRGE